MEIIKKLSAAMIVAVCFAAKVHATTSVYELGISTPALTAVLLVSGAGSLNDIEISSGAATTDHCVAFDSATVAGITTTSQDGTAAAKRLGTVNAATATAASFSSKLARSFTNGCVVICNVAVHAAAFISQ